MTPTGTKQRPEEDERYDYNPGDSQQHARENKAAGHSQPDREKADLSQKEQDAFDDIAANNQDLGDLKNQESNPNSSNSKSTPDAQEDQPWSTEVGQSQGSGQGTAMQYKKAGIIASIVIGAVLAGGGLFYGLINSFLITFKENYYEWSMKRGYTRTAQRAAKNFQKKYFSDPDSCRTGIGGIRCRYKSGVDERQLKKLQRNGVTVEYDKSKSKKNKYIIRSITLDDGTKLTKGNYLDQFKNNRKVRGFHARATDVSGTFPRTTKMVLKMNHKLKMSRKNPLKGGDQNERGFKKKMRAYMLGASGASVGTRAPDADRDKDGNVDNQDDIDKTNGLNEDIEKKASEERKRLLKNPFAKPSIKPDLEAAKGGAKGGLKGGLKGLSLIGATDSACTAYAFLRAVDYGAKYYRALALIRYAGFFMTFSDSIKAGEATPAQINFVAMKLFSTDDQGRNFWDSPGAQNVFYGKQPNPEAVANYTNGTTFAGVIGDVRNTIDKALGGNADETCDIVNNTFVQIGAVAVSIVVGFITGGASTVASVAAGASVGVILGVVQAWAVPILVQYAAGTVVTGDENGYEAGTAMAAGSGALGGQLSRTQGFRPMTDSEVAANQEELNTLYNDLFAHKKPSLTDKITTNFTAFATRMMMSPVFSTPQNLLAYAGTNMSIANVYAAEEVNNSNVCTDETYKKYNIATDAYCNPIYSENTAKIYNNTYDPEAVLRFMLADDNLNDDNPGNKEEAYVTAQGEPASTDNGERYKNYRDICMDGTAPMVDFKPEELVDKIPDEYNGTVDYCGATTKEFDMFRFFRMDSNITEPITALNDEFYSTPGGGAAAGSGQVADCGTAQECAKKILKNKNVTYQGSERANMQSIAKNGTSEGIKVSAGILQIVLSIAEQGINIQLSDITRPGANDHHGAGRAIDVGNESVAGKLFPYVYNNRQKLGVDELIYASPPSGTSNLDQGKNHQYGSSTISGHADHIHISAKQ